MEAFQKSQLLRFIEQMIRLARRVVTQYTSKFSLTLAYFTHNRDRTLGSLDMEEELNVLGTRCPYATIHLSRNSTG